MDLVLVVIGLIVLNVLALRYGHDSRENLQSKEQELACFGMKWPAYDVKLVERYRVRRRIARMLYALANRLSPEVSKSPARAQLS
jgi:hypothetical protein